MKTSLLVPLLGFSLTSLAAAQTIYQIDLRDHTRLLANDSPTQRGRLALFHRYPDGVFLSIPEEEIVRVGTASARPARKTLLPGDAIDVGPTGGGHPPEVPSPDGSTATAQANDSSNGLMNSGYYGYRGLPPHGMGPQLNTFAGAPSVIRPNGFPTMTNPSAPRGSK
jgi:hypothetical protein